jgi:integrase
MGLQWIFPVSTDSRTGERRRHHLHKFVPQRAIREARRHVGIAKPGGPHTLRHCFVTHSYGPGVGHSDVKTTMIYTHALYRGDRGVQSPADRLLAGFGEGC